MISFKKNVIACLLIGLMSWPISLVGARQADQPAVQDKPSEIWFGVLDAGVAKLRLQINLKIDQAGNVTGELQSLDQTSTPLPLSNVVRSPEKLAFAVPRLGITFEGTVDAGGKLVSGLLTQQGKQVELQLRRSEEAVTITHQATWTGKFSAGPQVYDFQFKVFEDSFQNFSVKLDSFTEGLWGIPCEFEKQDNQVTFRNLMTKGQFVGQLNAAGDSLEGNWNQRGLTIPVTLSRVPLEETREAKFHRPQTPQAPFPYQQKDFAIVVREIDPKFEPKVGIAGTMTFPEVTEELKGPFPTVILINGSGQQDRDFTVMGHKPFAVIADYLTRNGFAVLRYDDRGAGQSVGNVASATMMNYANDAEAVYLWALKQPEVDPKRVVVLGHSEGAMIAGMLAMRQAEIAGIILVAGAGTNGREVFLQQSAAIAKASGIPEDVINRQQQFFNEVFGEAKQQALEPSRVQELFQTHFGEMTDQQKLEYGLTNLGEVTSSLLASPWMRFYFDYDPRTALAYVKCPILAVFGERDLQSNGQVQGPAIRGATEVAQNLDFELEILPGLNHMLQPAQTGSPREYYQIETSLDPSALELIGNWLKRRFK